MGTARLRRVVRSLLEAAVAGGQAKERGLALLRSTATKNVVYVLYDPAAFLAATKEVERGDELSVVDPSSVVYGYMEVRPHRGDAWGSGEVKMAAAVKGYGPLLYEIAMADFGRIMPDRGTTSMAARNVWRTYASRSDVKSLPLDDEDEPRTPSPADDAHLVPDPTDENGYLNSAYEGSGDSIGLSSLAVGHRKLLRELAKAKGFSAADVELALMAAGDEYFGSRYRNG